MSYLLKKTPCLTFVLFLFLLFSCKTEIRKGSTKSTSKSSIVKTTKADSIRQFVWNEHRNKLTQDGSQQVGLATYGETVVNYRRDGNLLMNVHLGKPTKIYEADQKHGWGFVQFPRIQRTVEGKIAVRWNLTEDKYTAKPKYGWKYYNESKKIWHFNWGKRPTTAGVEIPNGDKIYIYRKKIQSSEFPEVEKLPALKNTFTGRNKAYNFYSKESLPKALTGFYLSRLKDGKKEYKTEFSPIENDPHGVVSLQEGTFNIKGWGDLRVDKDQSIVKMVYGTFQQTKAGKISLSSPSFYRSTTYGKSWEFIGKVPFSEQDFMNSNKGQIPVGLDEASFEILDNGTYVCVMRSSDGANTTPMYVSFSNDKGETWSNPQPFTNNGVLPQLQQLENNILVLSSGRDGVQLRFNIEGDGLIWSDPFELLRHKGIAGQVSCGYTGILPTGKNRFLIVYSDFKNRNDKGKIRKAIMVREVFVEN